MESPQEHPEDQPQDLETLPPDWSDRPDAPAAPSAPPSPPRRSPKRLAAALVLATMTVGAFGGYAIARSRQSNATSVGTTSAASVTPSTNEAGAAGALSLAQIQAAVDPALVDVTSTLGDSGTAKGTGMVISSTARS